MIFHKNVPYLILHQWPKFKCHTFYPSQDIKQNVLLSSYLDGWWHHKLEDLSWINLSSNGWQGEKEGKVEIKKNWISRERKELFTWNNKHLSYFLKGHHLVKTKHFYKKLWTQALSCFSALRKLSLESQTTTVESLWAFFLVIILSLANSHIPCHYSLKK